MPIFIDSEVYAGQGQYSVGNQTYQASDGYDLFIFSTRDGNGRDAILNFGQSDKIRFTDFNEDFDDLTFEVDASAHTITIRYDDSDNRIVLRNASDLIDGQGNHLLTAENFHFALTDPNGRKLQAHDTWSRDTDSWVHNKLKGGLGRRHPEERHLRSHHTEGQRGR